LLISPFDDRIKRPTQNTSYQRNIFISELANEIIIAHAKPGSKTEHLITEILKFGKTVFKFDSEYNKNLIDLCVGVIDF